MLHGMSEVVVQQCPSDLHRDALRLVMQNVAPEQRGGIIEGLRPLASEGMDVFAALVIAQQGSELVGSGWLQPQVGRTATLWPPVTVGPHDAELQLQLALHALELGQQLPITLVQSLLERTDDPFIPVLQQAGFAHLADLIYLLLTVPRRCPPPRETRLRFVPGHRDPDLLEKTTVSTYRETLDCPGLEGRRNIKDILAGYRTVGQHDPDLWNILLWDDQPAGVLLMAPYPDTNQWELVYIGIRPEVRGQGLGVKILTELAYRASQAAVEHIVLAVDKANQPAVDMYAQAGYTEWARRVAYMKMLDAS